MTCERHDTGEGPCTCTLQEVQERANRQAARNAKERNIDKARAALTDTARPVRVKPGHTGPLTIAAIEEHR